MPASGTATAETMPTTPDTVASLALGVIHIPRVKSCHRREYQSIWNFCHRCWRKWQPRSRPRELFRQKGSVRLARLAAPHHAGAWNAAQNVTSADRIRSGIGPASPPTMR
jgi:hypothetical protein